MSWAGQASEHDADHGEANEGGAGSRVSLEIAREAAMMADPRQSSFDDPAFGQDDEAVQLVALDDLQLPGAGICDGGRRLHPLISGIGEDALDEREEPSGASVENQSRRIAVLDAGGVDGDVQQEAECIDEDVPLAARDLLARIKALRVECGAPF